MQNSRNNITNQQPDYPKKQKISQDQIFVVCGCGLWLRLGIGIGDILHTVIHWIFSFLFIDILRLCFQNPYFFSIFYNIF
jgi:hypothetical protein